MIFNKKQKIVLLVSIIVILLLGISAEISYYTKSNSDNVETVINNEQHNEQVLKIELAKQNLQVKNVEKPTILFGSDYQGDNRYQSTINIFEQIKDKVNPNLFVMCGDYQVLDSSNYYNSEAGILELSNIFSNYYSHSIPQLYVQGNHDLKIAYGIAEDGIYESDKYIIYVINRDSFPNNQDQEINSEEVVKNTALKLKKDLQMIVDKKIRKPIFIATHVPLHYTKRNNGLDNQYAKYLVDVLQEYGKYYKDPIIIKLKNN